MKDKPLTNDQFKKIYSQVTRLTVIPVIINNKEVLLSLRNLPSWKGQWHIPGTTVLYQETIDRALNRVAQQELGIDIKIGKMLGFIEYISELKERGYGWSVALAFKCIPQSLNIRINSEASDVKFFSKLPENIVSEEKTFLLNHFDFLT